MIKRLVIIAASLFCMAVSAIVVGGIVWLNKNDLLPDISRRIGEPVTIELFGSGRVLPGERSFLHVVTHGKAGTVDWKIEPNEPNLLRVAKDGMSAEFTSAEPGQFHISVAVAGEGMTVGTDSLLFEVVEVFDEPADEDLAPITPPVDIEALKAAASALMTPPQPPTVAELTQRALAEVQSENKVEEAHRVAGMLRATINRISTGLVAPDADPLAEFEAAVELALGERAAAWGPFVTSLYGIVADLRLHGTITTAASTVPTLQEVVAVLSAVQ